MLIYSSRAALYVHTLGIYLVNFVHTLCIKQYSAANRYSAALRAAASTPCGNGKLIVIGYFNYL